MDILSIKKSLSHFLFLQMEIRNYTQVQFAEFLGISQGRLSMYLNMKEVPKMDFLLELADKTGVTIMQILNFDEDSNKSTVNQVGGVNINGSSNSVAFRDYFNNTTVRRINHLTRQPDDITAEQAAKLKDLVGRIVELEKKVKQKPKSYQAIWTALNRYMKVTYYAEIKAVDYFKAEVYLTKWLGRLKSAKSYIKNETDEWRKNRYKAIFTVGQKHLGMTKDGIDHYIIEVFGADSIKNLTNEELEKLYKRFMSKKNK